MTNRNLNTTWRDIIFKQYRQDHDADVLFPVRYLLYNDQWKRDLWYEIPKKIDPDTFRRSIVSFHRTTRGTESPDYEDEYITVRPRKPTATTTQALDVEIVSAQQDDVPEDEDDSTLEHSLAGPSTS